MPDDLRERIESLRRLRDAASPLPWGDYVVSTEDDSSVTYYAAGPSHYTTGLTVISENLAWNDARYMEAAVNLAPALADAYDAALATIAERGAEIASLREANARLTDAATNCALRATLSALSGATDG